MIAKGKKQINALKENIAYLTIIFMNVSFILLLKHSGYLQTKAMKPRMSTQQFSLLDKTRLCMHISVFLYQLSSFFEQVGEKEKIKQ